MTWPVTYFMKELSSFFLILMKMLISDYLTGSTYDLGLLYRLGTLDNGLRNLELNRRIVSTRITYWYVNNIYWQNNTIVLYKVNVFMFCVLCIVMLFLEYTQIKNIVDIFKAFNRQKFH